MKKEAVIILFILIFGIVIVSSGEFKDDLKLNIQNNDSVRVVIDIKEPAKEEGFIIKHEKSLEEIKIEKQNIKDEIINLVGKEDVERVFENQIAVEATKKEIEDLKVNPNVESIIIDRPIKAFLQDSVPLVNATRAWPIRISGLNITGIGESICIIDTGINFSHPDLTGKNMTACNIDCINPISGCVENCSVNDDHGHGTHVAGIAGGNGSIKGVAINVNLIGVKVLNSAGSGSGSDLDAGIDWCIANSAAYNISVISMSLGTDCTDTPEYCYNAYCDSVPAEQSTAIRIDNATAYNISVIIATGNDANYTHISSPACIQNATAVGATDKSDNIASSYSNRNNMTDLLAPGSNINSTKRAGGYEIRSGTSMATPHVAGAFALVRQFFRLQNIRVPTPSEIQNALNSSGRQIFDSSSGLNYSRINIYTAILSLDSIAPNVTLITPLNNTINSTLNQSFSCNATDLQLSNITFYLWNSTNLLIYNESKNISGESNTSFFNVTNLSYDTYKWNCLSYDLKNNSAFSYSNYSLILTYLIVSLVSPSDNLVTNQNQSFNCSYITDNSSSLKNSTLYVWNSSNSLVYNSIQNVSGLSNYSIFYYNFSIEGNYSWNCKVFNNNSNSVFSDSNFSISYDVTSPNIDSVSSSVSTSTSTLTWNTNENSNYSIIYGTNISNLNLNQTNSSLALNHSLLLSGLTSSSVYYYNITSCDNALNCITNGTYNFTTSAEVSSSSGGSSGGGGGGGAANSNTYLAKASEIAEGYTKQLNKNDKIEFSLPSTASSGGPSHTLIVNEVKMNYANITIRSNPITVILFVGESKKLNFTSPDYYDLYVKLESIENNKAKITMKTIHEDIIKNNSSYEQKTELPLNNSNIPNGTKNDYDRIVFSGYIKLHIIYIAVILFIIIITIIFLIKNKINRKDKNLKKYKKVFQDHIKPR